MLITRRSAPPLLLELLAHKLRWQLVQALGRSDYRVQELIAMLKQPPNLVSYHLQRLRAAHIVRERRSSADGRDVYYSLDVGKLRALYLASGDALHLGLNESESIHGASQARRVPRILFLCTHNSARSQMAEALARTLSKGRVEVNSAGTEPSRVHPDAIKAMQALDVDIRQQRSKHLDEFRGQKFDYVITVCDNARESCPIFPGDPARIHWSFEDPAAIEDPKERARAFDATAQGLATRIRFLLTMLEREGKLAP